MAFSRIKSNSTTRRNPKHKGISPKNRHPLFLCVLRVLQFIIALIALAAFASYLTKLPSAISRANGITMGVIASSFLYAAITVFTVFCIPYGSYILSVIMTVLDWAFAVGYVAVAVLVKPTSKCGRRGRVGRRQLPEPVDDDDSGDEDGGPDGESSSVGSSSATAAPIPTTTTALTEGSPGPTTALSSALQTGPSSIQSGVQTTLVSSQITQGPSPSSRVPTPTLDQISTSPTVFPTGASTSTNQLPTGIALAGQSRVEVGTSIGDCTLAMAVFVLAIISVLLYFASIFVPCALPPRKEEVEGENFFHEEVFEKKSVDGESTVYSESGDHVHDDPSVPAGPWARSAVV